MSEKRKKAPAEKTWTIESLEPYRGGLKATFSDGKSLLLSPESYVSGYYYPGKVLSAGEFAALKEEASQRKVKDYLSRLLSSGRYTVKDVSDRLVRKYSLSEKEIRVLLAPYQEAGVLDDEAYAMDFLESRQGTVSGPRQLESKLREKGVPEEVLAQKEVRALLNENEVLLPEAARKLLLTATGTLSQRKEKVLSSLLRHGFSLSVSQEALSSALSSLSDEEKEELKKQESVGLTREAALCYNSLRHRKLEERALRTKFFQSLRRKGYALKDIEDAYRKEKEKNDQGSDEYGRAG